MSNIWPLSTLLFVNLIYLSMVLDISETMMSSYRLFTCFCLIFELSTGWTCPEADSITDYNVLVMTVGKLGDFSDSNTIKDAFAVIDGGISCGNSVYISYSWESLGKFVNQRSYHPQTEQEVAELISIWENDWSDIRSQINSTLHNETLIFSGSLLMLFNDSMLSNGTDIQPIGPSNYSVENMTRYLPYSMNSDWNLASSVYVPDGGSQPKIVLNYIKI